MINREVREKLPYDVIIFDNPSFDNSIIGVSQDARVIYNYNKMIEEYMQDAECTYIEALEFIEYNTMRALPYIGEDAPIILFDLEEII